MTFWLTIQVRKLVEILASIVSCHNLNNKRIEVLETNMADLQTGFNDLKAAVEALVAEDASVVAAIKALRDQVAAGSPVTGDQLEALAAQVSGVGADLSAAIG